MRGLCWKDLSAISSQSVRSGERTLDQRPVEGTRTLLNVPQRLTTLLNRAQPLLCNIDDAPRELELDGARHCRPELWLDGKRVLVNQTGQRVDRQLLVLQPVLECPRRRNVSNGEVSANRQVLLVDHAQNLCHGLKRASLDSGTNAISHLARFTNDSPRQMTPEHTLCDLRRSDHLRLAHAL